MSIAYVNGSWVPLADATVPVLDRGFLFADAVYEVFAVFGGELFCGSEHLQRLDRSLAEVGIDNPHDVQQWNAIFRELLTRNDASDAAIYLQVTRGVQAKRGLLPSPNLASTVVAFLCPMKSADAEIRNQGVACATMEDQRWGRCDIKSVALLPNVMAQMKAAERGAHEAILLRDGELTEGASSNVFVVINGQVVTPPNSKRLLPGITREVILELLTDLGIDHHTSAVSESQLRGADEIWITSSTREIFPVTRLDDAPVGSGKPGPVWSKTLQAIQNRRSKK